MTKKLICDYCGEQCDSLNTWQTLKGTVDLCSGCTLQELELIRTVGLGDVEAEAKP